MEDLESGSLPQFCSPCVPHARKTRSLLLRRPVWQWRCTKKIQWSCPPASGMICCAGALHIFSSHPESDQQIFSSAKMLPVTWGMAPYRCYAKLFFPSFSSQWGHENTNLNLLVSVWWLLLQTHHHQHQEEDPRPKTQKAAHSPWCLTNSFRTRVAGGLSRKTHRSPIGLKNQRPLNFNFGA